MNFQATYFGSSSWLVELDGFKILIDPWLKGDLVFRPGAWLIKGCLQKEIEVPDQINLLLLTQGLPDHAHPPSLNLLERSISCVGSHNACNVLEKLKFENINPLKPQDTIQIGPISIEATTGAKVPFPENGYIVSSDQFSFYIEPHGFFDESISPRSIDAVFSPVVDMYLPLAGSFIKGKSTLPLLVECFKPKIFLSTTTGGDAVFTGLLNDLIQIDGNDEEAETFLSDKSFFINPKVGVVYDLNKTIFN